MEPLFTIQGPEATLFWFLAPLSVIAALGMLLVKKAVHSALLLAWVMILPKMRSSLASFKLLFTPVR